MKSSLFSLLIILIFVCASFGQSDLKNPVVYVYGDSATNTLDKIKPMIFLDGAEIAQIRPEHYFIAILPEGEHSLHFKEKKRGGILMNFEKGKTYFLKVTFSDAKSRFLKASIRPTGIEEVQEKAAGFVINEIKTVDPENIKNNKIVFLSLPTLSKKN